MPPIPASWNTLIEEAAQESAREVSLGWTMLVSALKIELGDPLALWMLALPGPGPPRQCGGPQ